MTGWKVTAGSVDWINGYWTPPSGSLSLDINGSSPPASSAVGEISQTFATAPNATYAVQFDLAGNPMCGPATKTLIVSATPTSASSETYSFTNTSLTTLTNMGWTAEEYSFVATSDSTTLSFAADPTNTSNCGAALASVSMTSIAATSVECKDGGWMSMYDSSGALFKNQGDCVSFCATSGATPIGS